MIERGVAGLGTGETWARSGPVSGVGYSGRGGRFFDYGHLSIGPFRGHTKAQGASHEPGGARPLVDGTASGLKDIHSIHRARTLLPPAPPHLPAQSLETLGPTTKQTAVVARALCI